MNCELIIFSFLSKRYNKNFKLLVLLESDPRSNECSGSPKCGPRARNISITWELAGTAHTHTHTHTRYSIAVLNQNAVGGVF